MEEKNKILEENGVEVEDNPTINIEEPFDPKRIDISTKQMILEVIFRRLRNNEIDLDTFFQRKMDLWDATKQSRLIESILIRLPLPAFYFDGTDDSHWLVVDGLQRLSTFRNFIVKKTMILENLEYLTQFNGYSFDRLPRELQRRIEEHEITVYIINPGTPEDVKYNIFRRINTGGLTLKAQEIRHALNQGIPTDFIDELAELDEFKKFGISTNRMLDRDFVTRFVSFRMNGPDNYKPDLDTFLNKSMSQLKTTSKETRTQIKGDFNIALKYSSLLFGDDAFRKISKTSKRRSPLNKALFEVWTVSIAKLDIVEIIETVLRKEKIIDDFIALLHNDKDFEKAITTGTGDVAAVKKRFKAIEELLQKVLND